MTRAAPTAAATRRHHCPGPFPRCPLCSYFYQDGTIGYEIKLTGELSTNLVSPGEGRQLDAEVEGGSIEGPQVQPT